MNFLKTLLGALAVCAALLAGAALLSGPDRSGMRAQASGLTAAAVLASDGMAPDGRLAGSDPGSLPRDRLVRGDAGGDQPAG